MTSIQILGAGAIGAFLASSLASAGHEVTVVARGARGDLLHKAGITLEQAGRRTHVSPAVVPDCAATTRPDVVVLCTKSPDLESALDMLEVYRRDPPMIVTVQNGVDAPQQVVGRFPDAQVLAARVHGFFELDGSTVRHVGVPPSVCFGCWNADSASATQLFADVLAAAGIANDVSADICRDLWEKFLLASTIGGVGTALAIPAGQILSDPLGRDILEAAMREVAMLAHLRGIALPENCVDKTLEFVASFPSDATSSLQRDLEARGPSEFEQLTGAVMRMARESDIDVPVNRAVVEMLAQRGLIKWQD